jgi:hypothetical protein
MKAQIFMLGFLLTYTSFALPECKAQSSVNHDIYKQSQQAMTKQIVKPSVEIEFVDRLQFKTLYELVLDVTLQNHYNQPCWFLLPYAIYLPIEEGGDVNSLPIGTGGVNLVEALRLNGKGRVILSRFLGDSQYQAFLLPAGAKLKLRRLSIALWDYGVLDEVQVQVVIASQLKINGEPVNTWLGINPMSDVKADVIADDDESLGSRRVGNYETVPVSIVEKERFKVLVPLF